VSVPEAPELSTQEIVEEVEDTQGTLSYQGSFSAGHSMNFLEMVEPENIHPTLRNLKRQGHIIGKTLN
jgi:hypothetical protein